MYIYKRNLGSESKMIRSFPDFFIIQNGKKDQNFHFEKKKRVKNGKNSQNFHFGLRCECILCKCQYKNVQK